MMERAKRLNASVSEVNERYHNSARSLERLRSGIHLSSLLLRDYLLDPRAERVWNTAARCWRCERRPIEHLDNLLKSMPSARRRKAEGNGRATQRVLGNLDPVFEWTPQEKQASASLFFDIV